MINVINVYRDRSGTNDLEINNSYYSIEVNYYILHLFQYNESASYMVSEMILQVFSVFIITEILFK